MQILCGAQYWKQLTSPYLDCIWSEEIIPWSTIIAVFCLPESYRLAPKHIAPAGFEDCVTAAKYFLSHAGEFNVDPTRVAVAGKRNSFVISAVSATYNKE